MLRQTPAAPRGVSGSAWSFVVRARVRVREACTFLIAVRREARVGMVDGSSGFASLKACTHRNRSPDLLGDDVLLNSPISKCWEGGFDAEPGAASPNEHGAAAHRLAVNRREKTSPRGTFDECRKPRRAILR